VGPVSRPDPAGPRHGRVDRRNGPYRAYFGLRRTYYAFDLGAWRLYALDSEDVSPAQLVWLRADLAQNPRRCILGYWYRPLFGSGIYGGDDRVRPFWRALDAAGADVVLNGADPDYERFTRLDPAGNFEWFHGIRSFVVGTGGQGLRHVLSTTPNTRAIQWWSHGVLRMRLGDRGYSWSFIPAGTDFSDYGGEDCR
jgi:hypothetical protein